MSLSLATAAEPPTSGQRQIIATLMVAETEGVEALGYEEIRFLLDRCVFAELVDLDRQGWVRIGETGTVTVTNAGRHAL